MNYIPKCLEDYSWRVKHELGFKFPPMMGMYVEQLIKEIWTNMKDQRYMYISHHNGPCHIDIISAPCVNNEYNHFQVLWVVNPRRMREGYGSHSVCLCVCVCVCVCLSVTALAATYLVYTLKAGYH